LAINDLKILGHRTVIQLLKGSIVNIADGANHTQEDGVQSSGDTPRTVQSYLCCSVAACNWFWGLVSSLDLNKLDVKLKSAKIMF
jgi:hypothetical protein